MANDYTGEAFLKALADGSLAEPLIRVGMVKHRADSCDDFLFSEGGCGSEWISVPIDLVEKVTFVRMLPCRDHQHPLVVVEFKVPKEDRAAVLFATLARSSSGARPAPTAGPMGAMGTSPPSVGTFAQASGTAAVRLAGLPCGQAGTPDAEGAAALARSAIGIGIGGAGGIGGAAFTCIAWHEECRWVDLWISYLGRSIPIFVCFNVCDRFGF